MVAYGANGEYVTTKVFVHLMTFKPKVVVGQVVISNKELVQINVRGANGVVVAVKPNAVQEIQNKEHVAYVVHKVELAQDVHGANGVIVEVKVNVDKEIQEAVFVALR